MDTDPFDSKEHEEFSKMIIDYFEQLEANSKETAVNSKEGMIWYIDF